MVAQFTEGQAGWQCWQEFTMTTKFRGKYLQVIPLGGASAMFPSSGNKYTWRKVWGKENIGFDLNLCPAIFNIFLLNLFLAKTLTDIRQDIKNN